MSTALHVPSIDVAAAKFSLKVIGQRRLLRDQGEKPVVIGGQLSTVLHGGVGETDYSPQLA